MMKNYVPAEQLQQCSDDDDVDTISQEKIDDCIRRADDLIDSYLRGRYSVPLSVVPELIKDLSVKLAVYFLFKRSLLLTLPDSIKDDYSDANSVLNKIQSGKITPFESTEEPAFFGTNKVDTDNVTATLTSSWEAY
jgi:phage gp36-like protein